MDDVKQIWLWFWVKLQMLSEKGPWLATFGMPAPFN